MDHLQTQSISLPRLGLGTYRMQGDACRAAVESALALGYRHIDAAEMYANEEAIGAIASSGVGRKARCAESRIRRRLPQGDRAPAEG
jgi:2,5-diketo-D-gluconate reductase B